MRNPGPCMGDYVSVPAAAPQCDLDLFHEMMSENEQMKNQLDLLRNDIDDAIDKGRNTVCWHVN